MKPSFPRRRLHTIFYLKRHPVGRAKAKYFRVLGYNEENAVQLKEGLLTVAADGMVAEVIDTPFWTKYVVDGDLLTPTGARAQVRTIWILETGQSVPRFVTAYPKGEKNKGSTK